MHLRTRSAYLYLITRLIRSYITVNCTFLCCRHVSRCLLIKFGLPEIGGCLDEDEQEGWNKLHHLWEKASSCIGYLVSLEDVLEKEGFKEIDGTFLPKVQSLFKGCLPRTILGYAILMWFSSKVTTIDHACTNSIRQYIAHNYVCLKVGEGGRCDPAITILLLSCA